MITRLFLPLLIVAVAIGAFFKLTDPLFGEIDILRAEQTTLNAGLDNAKKLRQVEQQLLDEYNAFAAEMPVINQLLPDNVDNVKLIIEINNIAKRYQMAIRNLQLKKASEDEKAEDVVARDRENVERAGITLGFSVQGSYLDFQSFLNDLAHNLRLTDVTTTGFAAAEDGKYNYNVEVQTYWLK